MIQRTFQYRNTSKMAASQPEQNVLFMSSRCHLVFATIRL